MNPFISDLFDLTGRTAFVTGASGGLGRHFALTLAKAGAAVALASRDMDRLASTAQDIEAIGGRACTVAIDITDRSSVSRALDAATSSLGPLDVLVNNAGVTDSKRALDYTDEDWHRIVDTNLTGAWMVAQEAARRMTALRRGGSIINVTSILASRVAGAVHPYAVSKAGLKHLTQALALEWARHGIRVNSLAPGYIATALNRDFLASDAGEALRSRIPTRRFGTPKDLDGALLLLASEAGSHLTGAEIVVDGGHLCSSL